MIVANTSESKGTDRIMHKKVSTLPMPSIEAAQACGVKHEPRQPGSYARRQFSTESPGQVYRNAEIRGNLIWKHPCIRPLFPRRQNPSPPKIGGRL
jgi:hypothetical protein